MSRCCVKYCRFYCGGVASKFITFRERAMRMNDGEKAFFFATLSESLLLRSYIMRANRSARRPLYEI